MSDNLYRQPETEVVSGERLSELTVHEPVHRSASHGYDWLADAWALFRRRPFMWALSAFLLWMLVLVFNLVMVFIPLIGSLAPTVLSPVFAVGLLHIARSVDRGEGIEIGDIFAGFRHQTGPLLGLGGLLLLLVFAMTVVMLVALFVIFGGDIFNQIQALEQQGGPPMPPSGTGMIIKIAALVLVMVTVAMLLGAAFWFAPALVYFGEVHPARALLMSFRGVLRNILSMTVYGLALIGLWILLMIPGLLMVGVPALMSAELASPDPQAAAAAVLGGGLGIVGMLLFLLGYLLLMLVTVISIYTAFRDIYIAPRGGAPAPA